jgi:hypothetical protein
MELALLLFVILPLLLAFVPFGNLVTGAIVLAVASAVCALAVAVIERSFRSVDPRNPPDYWPPAVRKAMRRHYR